MLLCDLNGNESHPAGSPEAAAVANLQRRQGDGSNNWLGFDCSKHQLIRDFLMSRNTNELVPLLTVPPSHTSPGVANAVTATNIKEHASNHFMVILRFYKDAKPWKWTRASWDGRSAAIALKRRTQSRSHPSPFDRGPLSRSTYPSASLQCGRTTHPPSCSILHPNLLFP